MSVKALSLLYKCISAHSLIEHNQFKPGFCNGYDTGLRFPTMTTIPVIFYVCGMYRLERDICIVTVVVTYISWISVASTSYYTMSL